MVLLFAIAALSQPVVTLRIPCDGRPDTGTVVSSLAVHGKLLACGGDDHCVRVYECARLVRTLRGHRGWVRTVAFSPDGRLLASAGDGPSILAWEVETGRLKHRIAARPGKIRCLAWVGSRRLAAGDTTNSIRVWTMDGKLSQRLRGHTGTVTDLVWASGMLISAGYDCTMRVWLLDQE